MEKGENDKEQRGGRRVRKREAMEEDEEREKEGKEAEDGDNSDREAGGGGGGGGEERVIEGKMMEKWMIIRGKSVEGETGWKEGRGRK